MTSGEKGGVVDAIKVSSRSSPNAVAGTSPSASMSPARRSESCWFIWHPKVRIR
jgi:hypothetical protein